MAAPCANRKTNLNVRSVTFTLILVYFYKCLAIETDDKDDYLLCRHCGYEITKAEDLMHFPSSRALRQRNDTILGVKEVLIQLFQNPQGQAFEVITSKNAEIFKDGKGYIEHSWFPGFSWKMSVCPRCGFHLGWYFEPVDSGDSSDESDRSFVGLILENLLHQDYADSLLITPKSYYS